MDLKIPKDVWMRKIRILLLILIVSGAFNICLAGFLVYSFIKERQFSIEAIAKPVFYKQKKEFTNTQYLSYFSSLSFRELLSFLSDKQLIEDGYTKRDLALGCLVTFHNFNIEKVLINQNLQKREIFFKKEGKENKISLFANLSDHHYENIIHFAYTEKWPLTSKGLFSILKNWKKPRDSSLEQAFIQTNEFFAVRTLFDASEIIPRSDVLLDVICEGKWELLEIFYYSQNQNQDLSNEKRRSFLHDYISQNSKSAALLLLQTDLIYVVKRLNDYQILELLDLLDEKCEDVEQFCCELLKSNRSDIIWKVSAEKLYHFANEPIPENIDHQLALERFVHSDELKMKWQIEEKEKMDLSSILWAKDLKKDNVHIVKDGENLWKIARMYKVEIEELIRLNNLETDKIFPGKEIVIP